VQYQQPVYEQPPVQYEPQPVVAQPQYYEPEPQYQEPYENTEPVYEGFRPPYAAPEVRTGFSNVIPPPKYAPKQYYEMDEVEPQSFPLPYEDEIEPSETFEDDANDLDEGTVIGTKTYSNNNLYQQPVVDPYEKISPRMKVNKAERLEKPPVEFNKIFKEDRPPMISDIEDQPELDNSRDEWKTIQKKIDSEYEKKLKEVSDDAMKKLKAFQTEHKALLEKTQFLLD